jgi:periplasmic divalent cation tolerance protein
VAGTRRKQSGSARQARRPTPVRRAPRAVLILAAYPRLSAAHRAARQLVRGRVLACATVTTGKAFYIWQGRELSELSAVLYGKTTAARAGDALRRIRESHPDKVPEILVLEIVAGEPTYLRWLAEQVTPR